MYCSFSSVNTDNLVLQLLNLNLNAIYVKRHQFLRVSKLIKMHKTS